MVPAVTPALLSRADARRYVGGVGSATFDREFGGKVRVVYLGKRRYYVRADLDTAIDARLAPVAYDPDQLLERL